MLQAWQGSRKERKVLGAWVVEETKWIRDPKLQKPRWNKSLRLFSTMHNSQEENKLRINNLKFWNHLKTLNMIFTLPFQCDAQQGHRATWNHNLGNFIFPDNLTNLILSCAQTLPGLYIPLDVRNMPLKRLQLKVVVLYNSVCMFLFHLCLPISFFKMYLLEGNTNQYFWFPKFTVYVFLSFCLLVEKNLNSQKINEFTLSKLVHLRPADLSLKREKHCMI